MHVTTYLIDKNELINIWNSKDKSVIKSLSESIEDFNLPYLEMIVNGEASERNAYQLKLLYEELAGHYGEIYEDYIFGNEAFYCVECLMDDEDSFFIPLPNEYDFPGIKSVALSDIDNLVQKYKAHLSICDFSERAKEDMTKEIEKLANACKENKKDVIFFSQD